MFHSLPSVSGPRNLALLLHVIHNINRVRGYTIRGAPLFKMLSTCIATCVLSIPTYHFRFLYQSLPEQEGMFPSLSLMNTLGADDLEGAGEVLSRNPGDCH